MCVYVPLQGGYNRSALHIASIKGLESAVAKLLSLGADAALKDEVRACSHRNTCMCSVHVCIFVDALRMGISLARALSRSLMCARTHSLAHTFTVSLSLSQCVVCKKVGRSGAMLTALWLSTISNNLISIIEQFQTI